MSDDSTPVYNLTPRANAPNPPQSGKRFRPSARNMDDDSSKQHVAESPVLSCHGRDTTIQVPRGPPTSATEPCFIPGHIRIDYQSRFAAILPLQILPAEHYGTHWAAENLSWESFVVLTQQKLNTTLLGKQLLAHVGQPELMPINEPRDWYVAMQMCHDLGLKTCVFRVLVEDVVVEPESEPQAAQQVPQRGWKRTVAAVGAIGAIAATGVAGAVLVWFLP